ncbi:DUF2252 domain-containing protein [Pseudonocardia sp. CA-107938]|uniref:DUF2252 domain-containing protein n=1 Tax=Pseudonocardia sp. CA-107938 TaxID=3240021 RepID=UPI003D90087C
MSDRQRRTVRRSAHAELPARSGPDATEIVLAQDAGRVPELVPLRHARMAVSPFAFFRGAAAVMAADLAATPVSGTQVQLCGDAHLANFGFFASPERRLVFDVNDFDETLPGPWEWDVKRLAASVEVAARDRGFADGDRREIVTTTVRAYRRAMRGFAKMTNLEVWYAIADERHARKMIEGKGSAQRLAKARKRDHRDSLARFATVEDGTPRIVADPPLVVPLHHLVPKARVRRRVVAMLETMLAGYRESLLPERRRLFDQYRLTDIAQKVVGVGSVGNRCWMLLFIGRDADDPLFLQAKEAGPSVLEPYLGDADHGHDGQRVVEGQRLMQTVSDIFLGWQRITEPDGTSRDYYVRQLRDWKGSIDVEEIERPDTLASYAGMCAWSLARAHARTGDRAAIAAYLGSSGKFDDAVATFADAYADRTEADHAAFAAAVTAP